MDAFAQMDAAQMGGGTPVVFRRSLIAFAQQLHLPRWAQTVGENAHRNHTLTSCAGLTVATPLVCDAARASLGKPCGRDYTFQSCYIRPFFHASTAQSSVERRVCLAWLIPQLFHAREALLTVQAVPPSQFHLCLRVFCSRHATVPAAA